MVKKLYTEKIVFFNYHPTPMVTFKFSDLLTSRFSHENLNIFPNQTVTSLSTTTQPWLPQHSTPLLLGLYLHYSVLDRQEED